jgi:hypothetical protein
MSFYSAILFPKPLETIRQFRPSFAIVGELGDEPEDWRWSSYNEYTGTSADEQNDRCGLIGDRVRMPSDPRARI